MLNIGKMQFSKFKCSNLRTFKVCKCQHLKITKKYKSTQSYNISKVQIFEISTFEHFKISNFQKEILITYNNVKQIKVWT